MTLWARRQPKPPQRRETKKLSPRKYPKTAYQVIPQEERFLQKDCPPKIFFSLKPQGPTPTRCGRWDLRNRVPDGFADCGHFPEDRRTAPSKMRTFYPTPGQQKEPSFHMNF